MTLWDDEYVKQFASGCGLDVVNPVLHFGKEPVVTSDGVVGMRTKQIECLPNEIASNKHIDHVCGYALPVIESAIADLDQIPDTWSGYVPITAENTGYPFEKFKTYHLDYADAQMIKATFRAVMSFLELSRGYNPNSAGAGPDGINRAALAAARDYYLKAVESLLAYNVAHGSRYAGNDYLFRLKPFESDEITKYAQSLRDLPWWTAEIQLIFFAESSFNKQRNMPWKQWKNPEEEIERKKNLIRGKRLYLSLKSLFDGEVSLAKGTFPKIVENHVLLGTEGGLTDPTFGAMFPDLTRKALGELVNIFDTEMPEYEPETIAKYHAVVYKLPAGAKNHPENPQAYMTEDCPIVLKEPTLEGHVFIGWSNNGVIPAWYGMPMTFTATFLPAWEYVTANGTVSVCTNAVVVTADTATFEDGEWYVVTDTVECNSITVNGAAHLILCDGAKLTANAVAGGALTVYGQPSGCGELKVLSEVSTSLICEGGILSAAKLSGDSLTVVGGTLEAGTIVDCKTTISGGSVKAGTIQNTPTNSANAAVYCVTMEGLEGLVSLEGLEGYGTRDIEPIDGKVYLYLPNGTYYFKVNDQWYKAVVKDAATVAEAHSPAAVKVISAKQRWPWNGKIDVVSSVVRLDATKYYQLVMDLTLGETTKRVSYELGAGKDATYTNTVDCAALFGENVVGEVSINVSLVVTDVGETVDKADSYMAAVDTRKVKEITGSAGSVTVDLTYSGNNWGETAGGGAAIAVAFKGGEAKPLATGLTSEGTVPWKPEFYGLYDLTHTADDITETAIFKFLRSPSIILIFK